MARHPLHSFETSEETIPPFADNFHRPAHNGPNNSIQQLQAKPNAFDR